LLIHEILSLLRLNRRILPKIEGAGARSEDGDSLLGATANGLIDRLLELGRYVLVDDIGMAVLITELEHLRTG
jgi:hypothetical protein